MTVGELAGLFNAERRVGARLEVIRCRGWSREQTYDRTGLLWINPSPNMRSLTEAMLYPGVGWLEATNLATGRGTDTPFERIGAPWIDPLQLGAALNQANVAGTRFVPIRFVPRERQYQGQQCGGVQIVITDWKVFDPLRLGLTIAVTLRKQYRAIWKPEALLPLIGDLATYEAILAGRDAASIEDLWQAELVSFLAIRSRYLLYE
jgi:uncharacterized protein YbbC (DUF1343 family)